MTWRVVMCIVGMAGLTGCTGSESAETVTVSAASSLTDAFEVLTGEFTASHPDVDVELAFGSSSSLAAQIEEGAPADVFVSASPEVMEDLVEADHTSGPTTALVRNRLSIAVKPGNPQDVRSLADLRRLGVVALCARDAPCGELATRMLERAGVVIHDRRVSRAPNARATLTAVAAGDADAAIVYVTDVMASGDSVTPVEIPDPRNVVTEYVIAVLANAEPSDLARQFVEFVTSERERTVYAELGFLAE